MVRKPAPAPTREPEASPADQAFGAAASFIEHLGTLAYHARQYQPRADNPDEWKHLGATYALAFIAWFDLSHLLTPAVRNAARRVYPAGSPSIKLGRLRPKPTVIETVADELGVYFRNVLYQDRQCPLDPDWTRVADGAKAQATARQVAQGKVAEPFGWGADFDELMKKETRAAVRERLGIKTWGDAFVLMCNEWENQDPKLVESKLQQLRCGSIDFDDLRTQLDREALAVLPPADDLIDRLASAPTAPVLSDDELARLRAHLKAPVRLSDLRRGPARRDRLRKLQEILHYNDDLCGRRTADRPPVAPTPSADPAVHDDSHLSPAKLAEIFGIPADPLRTRLNRWRAQSHTGWIENPDRGSREAKYLYRLGSVRAIIEALRATSETTSERPPKKI